MLMRPYEIMGLPTSRYNGQSLVNLYSCQFSAVIQICSLVHMNEGIIIEWDFA